MCWKGITKGYKDIKVNKNDYVVIAGGISAKVRKWCVPHVIEVYSDSIVIVPRIVVNIYYITATDDWENLQLTMSVKLKTTFCKNKDINK